MCLSQRISHLIMKTNPASKPRPLFHSLRPLCIVATAAAALWLPGSSRASEVYTHIGNADVGSPYISRTQTSAGALTDSATGIWTTTTTSANYGQISITGDFSIPAFNGSNYANSAGSATGQWTDTWTIYPMFNPSLLGQPGVLHLTLHLAGSITSTVLPMTNGWNDATVYLDGATAANVGYRANYGDDPVLSHYSTFTYDRGFTFGTPFDLSVKLDGTLHDYNYTTDTAGATFHQDLTLASGGFTVSENGNLMDPSSYSSTSTSGTDYSQDFSQPTPEPSTWVTLTGGIALLALRRRRVR